MLTCVTCVWWQLLQRQGDAFLREPHEPTDPEGVSWKPDLQLLPSSPAHQGIPLCRA